MAHPYHHALSSVRKWGGAVEDYIPIHDWFDASKMILADFRHRCLRHHSEGIYMAETLFWLDPSALDRPGNSRAVDRRTAHPRGPRLYSVLCRLGQGDPPGAVDGPRGEAGGRGARAAGLRSSATW
jgi:hypothetical protein